MNQLNSAQRGFVEKGYDKRCVLLLAPLGATVQWHDDGVTATPGGRANLPIGYRVRNTAREDGVTAHFIWHESYSWVKEGQSYPKIELSDLTPQFSA